MQFGNLAGLINGTESLVFDYEVTGSAVNYVDTGSILNGNEDGWYTIIIREVGGATNSTTYMQFNGDDGANYGRKGLFCNTNVADWSATGEAGAIAAYGVASGSHSLGVSKLYAKFGAVRLVNTMFSGGISDKSINSMFLSSSVWDNTTDNLTSIKFTNYASGGYAVGSRFIILKSNNFTGGTPTGVVTTPYVKGSWVRVASSVLTANSASVTFSNLDGDRDVLYALSVTVRQKTASGQICIKFNGDTTAQNYGYQYLICNSTGATAGRAATATCWYMGVTTEADGYGAGYILMFAKQGFIRPSLSQFGSGISSTTVTDSVFLAQSYGVTNTNITSMVISAPGASTGVLGAGSHLELYALRPNG